MTEEETEAEQVISLDENDVYIQVHRRLTDILGTREVDQLEFLIQNGIDPIVWHGLRSPVRNEVSIEVRGPVVRSLRYL